MLSSIGKILLARAHGVSAWLYEAIGSLVTCDLMPPFEDFTILGWEAVARILWMRKDDQLRHFKPDAIKCMNCSLSLSLKEYNSVYPRRCAHVESKNLELTFLGLASPIPGSVDFSVPLDQIQCLICETNPLPSIDATCKSCSYTYHYSKNPTVRVQLFKMRAMIEEMFGEKMKDHEREPSLPV
jgi:hypothetical protein